MAAGGWTAAFRCASAGIHAFDSFLITCRIQPCFMCALERDPIPDHSTGIKRIAQYALDRAALHKTSTPGMVSKIVALSGNCCWIEMLEVILVHDVFDDLIFRFVNYERLAAACGMVSQTGRCLITVLQCFFLHTAQDFAGETDGVVFIHPFDDTLDQCTEWTVDQRLGNTDHIHITFF